MFAIDGDVDHGGISDGDIVLTGCMLWRHGHEYSDAWLRCGRGVLGTQLGELISEVVRGTRYVVRGIRSTLR